MIARYALGIFALLASTPALAQSLDAAAAQRFALDKLFDFTCVDGSRGSGRVFDDGSVIGTIQLGGVGSDHLVWLRAGTLKVKGDKVCAALDGLPFEPCFDLNKTDNESFRGSVSGSNFAYCDFTHPPVINDRTAHLQPSKPLPLDPAHNKRTK
jgi:hypothetical protein